MFRTIKTFKNNEKSDLCNNVHIRKKILATPQISGEIHYSAIFQNGTGLSYSNRRTSTGSSKKNTRIGCTVGSAMESGKKIDATLNIE